MTPEQFFEQLKQMFESQNENDEAHEGASNTNISRNNVIVRPKKNYIKVKEILTLFGITKPTYNNMLVRK